MPPKKVLTTEPRPPIKLVPPMTTAAITTSSAPIRALVVEGGTEG